MVKPGSDDLHYLSCPSNKNIIIQRHNELRDLVVKYLIKSLGADVSCTVDPCLTGFTVEDGSKVYADMRVCFGRKVFFLDVSWINPASRTARGNGSLVCPGSAALQREKEKEKWYASNADKEVLSRIIPFVAEATGRLGMQAMDFAKVYMAGAPGSTNLFQFKRDVCVTAARYQAKMQRQFMRYKAMAPVPARELECKDDGHDYHLDDEDDISVQGDDLVSQQIEADARKKERHHTNLPGVVASSTASSHSRPPHLIHCPQQV
jgi:hypothetical protein